MLFRSYGGRAEIAAACTEIARLCSEKSILPEDITESLIEEHLYTSTMPPLDMVIRPSGEQRLSNFMIWQAAYAEFVFMDVLWPDFKKKDLVSAMDIYAERNRRFGGL